MLNFILACVKPHKVIANNPFGDTIAMDMSTTNSLTSTSALIRVSVEPHPFSLHPPTHPMILFYKCDDFPQRLTNVV